MVQPTSNFIVYAHFVTPCLYHFVHSNTRYLTFFTDSHMQQILIDHIIKIALPISCIFSPYCVQDISSFYLVQQILLYVKRVGGLTALDSCTAAILNLRPAQVGRERCDEIQSAGCDLLGNPHRSCYPAVPSSHSNYVLSDSRCVQHRHMYRCFNKSYSPLHGMNTYRTVEIQLHRFLSYTVYGDEWSFLRLGCLTHGKIHPLPPRNQFYKGLCGFQSRSDSFGQKVNLLACCESSRCFFNILSEVSSLFNFAISGRTRYCLLLQAYLFACYKTIFKILRQFCV